MDLRIFWRQFSERLVSVEADGPAELLHASFVGGPKRLPIRLRLEPAA